MKQLVDILDSDLTMSQSKQDNHIPAIHIRDSALLGSFGGTLMPKPKEYIFDVANKQEFRDWYLTAKSQTIIINDMKMNSLSQNALSPMSYMCHEFMKPPSRDKDRLEDNIGKPFVFYCGLHSSPEDEFYGAEGILRSFIIQLLEAYGHKIDLSFLDPIAIQELQAHYVPRLQSLLEKIMYGIGVGVVFLLIDGISWYERDAQIEKTTMVMSFLGDLVEKMEARQTGLILKPLITTTGFNRRARMWFPNAIELFM
ncbi:hypothetical protein N7456_011966 [Penicillium angulare]|uniref:Uncharacterized protein n=1 Tax=Penicillium angulare TaxID=116970 RepID=A0A9W9K0L1_9EURO|nr:hypothetical protein N7456_011966 [Penicillium angulare]